MTQTNLYPLRHADSGHGSTVNGTTSAQGQIGWSVELGKVATPFWPGQLLVWQGRPLVYTYDTITLADGEGRLLWTLDKLGGGEVGLAPNNLVHYRNPSRSLDAVDMQKNRVLKSAPFPGRLTAEMTVLGFWPDDTDYVAVLYDPPPMENRSGPPSRTGAAKQLDDSLTIVRNNYTTPYGDLLHRVAGKSRLPPLLVPGTKIVAYVQDAYLMRLDTQSGTELPRIKLPLYEVQEWSVDASQRYAITAYEQGRKALIVVSGQGEILWRWEDRQDTDAWAKLQPPVRAKTGRVVVLTEGRVLSFDQGRLLWSFDLRSEGLQHGARIEDGGFEVKDGRLLAKGAARHATGLADGSLLVSSGKTLFHLTPEGKKHFSITLDQDILSSPVIDHQGSIYVTTATHLVKIR